MKMLIVLKAFSVVDLQKNIKEASIDEQKELCRKVGGNGTDKSNC